MLFGLNLAVFDCVHIYPCRNCKYTEIIINNNLKSSFLRPKAAFFKKFKIAKCFASNSFLPANVPRLVESFAEHPVFVPGVPLDARSDGMAKKSFGKKL